MKEVLPKSSEPVPEEVPEPSTQKKSRLDDDDDPNTIHDDGQIWSKPISETREATRLVYSSILIYLTYFYLEKTNSTNIFKHYFSKYIFLIKHWNYPSMFVDIIHE